MAVTIIFLLFAFMALGRAYYSWRLYVTMKPFYTLAKRHADVYQVRDEITDYYKVVKTEDAFEKWTKDFEPLVEIHLEPGGFIYVYSSDIYGNGDGGVIYVSFDRNNRVCKVSPAPAP